MNGFISYHVMQEPLGLTCGQRTST